MKLGKKFRKLKKQRKNIAKLKWIYSKVLLNLNEAFLNFRVIPLKFDSK